MRARKQLVGARFFIAQERNSMDMRKKPAYLYWQFIN